MKLLVEAEEKIRARGLTGARAFEALVLAIRAHLGDDVQADPRDLACLRGLAVDSGQDLLGLAYERFFADLFKGRRGQYFTPGPIVELILDLLDLRPGERVLDPTCGSGGFLVRAARHGCSVSGIELDPYLVDLAALNLRLVGADGSIRCEDAFVAAASADVVVANPPFSVDITSPDVLARYELARGHRRALTDVLFVEALAGWLPPGGRAGVVLPFSFLTNARYEQARAFTASAFSVRRICALPEGIFRPFGGAAGRAVVLWLCRRPCEESEVAWAELQDPGYDPRSVHLRTTSDREVRRLANDEGWCRLPAGSWTPPVSRSRGTAVGSLARVRHERIRPGGPCVVAELADADKSTGEITSARSVPPEDLRGSRLQLRAGDVVVSRMRPELGNVAIVPSDMLGSPEWIVLADAQRPLLLKHLLRTPSWRGSLPVTSGQTRPRTSREAVEASLVPVPPDEVADRIEALSREIHAARRRLRGELDALQHAVDAYADGGELDELLRRLDAIRPDRG